MGRKTTPTLKAILENQGPMVSKPLTRDPYTEYNPFIRLGLDLDNPTQNFPFRSTNKKDKLNKSKKTKPESWDY